MLCCKTRSINVISSSSSGSYPAYKMYVFPASHKIFSASYAMVHASSIYHPVKRYPAFCGVGMFRFMFSGVSSIIEISQTPPLESNCRYTLANKASSPPPISCIDSSVVISCNVLSSSIVSSKLSCSDSASVLFSTAASSVNTSSVIPSVCIVSLASSVVRNASVVSSLISSVFSVSTSFSMVDSTSPFSISAACTTSPVPDK